LQPEKKCIVEGVFEIKAYGLRPFFEAHQLDYEDECIVRRQISPGGRSRAFINDQPVKLEVLKQLSRHLMDIHSQHDTLLLTDVRYQLGLLDSFAKNKKEREDYATAYRQLLTAQKDLKKLRAEAQESQKELDYNQFLLKELETLPLENLNQDDLEQAQERLDNTEQIQESLAESAQLLSEEEVSVMVLLQEVRSRLSKITPLSSSYEKLYERLESARLELEDLGQEFHNELENLYTNPEEAEKIRETLSTLYRLQQKHGCQDVATLRQLRDDLAQKVHLAVHFDETLADAEARFQEAEAELKRLGQKLTESRKKSKPHIEKKINDLLGQLALPKARFAIALEAQTYSPDGADAIDFMFSANTGMALAPVGKVASGGEFSRLMLAIKAVLAERQALPTIIFDEIDTGISGEVALKVSFILEQMAGQHQLIAISHMPQIASRAAAHFKVSKKEVQGKTESSIALLPQEERVREIAEMIGGKAFSDSAKRTAEELLG
jgi:DNA repair protein RecN (Recombination protein N)